MKLADLIDHADATIDVSGLCEDSRTVEPGDAFVALQGASFDGMRFAEEAVGRGAVAVLTDRPAQVDLPVPVLVVPNLSDRVGELAARCYDQPGGALRCIGVTGTNGKTSVAYYAAQVLERLAEPCGYVGTIGWGRLGELEDSSLTTASASETQRRLARLRDSGARWAALETSSHALVQGRVEAVPIEAAVFTNLSRDHLDYHGTMDAYGAAKRQLFDRQEVQLGVINSDDAFGARLAEEFAARYRVLTYGREAAVQWRDLSFTLTGVAGEWHTPWGRRSFELPLIGEFSVANSAAVLALMCGLGFDFADVADALCELQGVPGRMEFVALPAGPAVVVDYAHTPDALANVLTALRRHCRGDLICVVGCGGDRDAGKRPLMAAVAETSADVLWMTSDNPRSEDPEKILDDMRTGLTGQGCVFECVDRADAIERAVSCASGNDIVLVAGKGHEDYQELADGRVPFSDRECVARLKRKRVG